MSLHSLNLVDIVVGVYLIVKKGVPWKYLEEESRNSTSVTLDSPKTTDVLG